MVSHGCSNPRAREAIHVHKPIHAQLVHHVDRCISLWFKRCEGTQAGTCLRLLEFVFVFTCGDDEPNPTTTTARRKNEGKITSRTFRPHDVRDRVVGVSPQPEKVSIRDRYFFVVFVESSRRLDRCLLGEQRQGRGAGASLPGLGYKVTRTWMEWCTTRSLSFKIGNQKCNPWRKDPNVPLSCSRNPTPLTESAAASINHPPPMQRERAHSSRAYSHKT